MEASLPTLENSVDHMSQLELRAFIPQILRLETNKSQNSQLRYENDERPKWWPGDLPYSSKLKQTPKDASDKNLWTTELRKIVRNCYQYYGQEHLLNGHNSSEGSIKVVNNQDGSVSFITEQTVVTLEDRQNTPYASRPSTHEAATPGRSLSACNGMMPRPQALFRSNNNSEELLGKPFVEVFMCYRCEKQFVHRDSLRQHQRFTCSLYPAALAEHKTGYKTRRQTQLRGATSCPYQKIKVIPRPPRKLIEEKVIFPSKSVYVEALNLLPQAKAERVRRQSQGRRIDCALIDVDDMRPSKTPPRTPKSLISQLSRDASPPGRNRLLSRDVETPIRTRLILDGDDEYKEENKDVSDDESECSKSDSGEDKYRPRRVANLLNIDLSSLLGERVQKHITAYFINQSEDKNSKPNCYESYCRTPTKTKNLGRLRSRGSEFQVTFKKAKRTAIKYTHTYKFRRSELNDFCRVVETGLNRRSRRLKRLTKKCKVVLAKLEQRTIDRWLGICGPPPISPQKQNDIRRWMENSGSPFSSYLRSLLTDSDNVTDHRSCERYLYKNIQNANASKVDPVTADLTPPSTPEGSSVLNGDDDIIILDDCSQVSKPPILKAPSNSPVKQPRKTLTPRKWVEEAEMGQNSDDAISISSTESDELRVISPVSLKRAANFSPTDSRKPEKRRRLEELGPAALLFRCHLCLEELTCHNGANIYIKQHFASKHNVFNIDLIEHLGATGQKVVSIVEVPCNLNAQMNLMQVKNFYSGNNGSTKPPISGKTINKSFSGVKRSQVAKKSASSRPKNMKKVNVSKDNVAKSKSNVSKPNAKPVPKEGIMKIRNSPETYRSSKLTSSSPNTKSTRKSTFRIAKTVGKIPAKTRHVRSNRTTKNSCGRVRNNTRK